MFWQNCYCVENKHQLDIPEGLLASLFICNSANSEGVMYTAV